MMSRVEQIDHPPEERAASPHPLACVVEQPHQGVCIIYGDSNNLETQLLFLQSCSLHGARGGISTNDSAGNQHAVVAAHDGLQLQHAPSSATARST